MAVLVRDSLSCDRIIIDTGPIENMAVHIHRINGGSITVVSMYLKPTATMSAADNGPVIEMVNIRALIIGIDLNGRHTY